MYKDCQKLTSSVTIFVDLTAIAVACSSSSKANTNEISRLAVNELFQFKMVM